VGDEPDGMHRPLNRRTEDGRADFERLRCNLQVDDDAAAGGIAMRSYFPRQRPCWPRLITALQQKRSANPQQALWLKGNTRVLLARQLTGYRRGIRLIS